MSSSHFSHSLSHGTAYTTKSIRYARAFSNYSDFNGLFFLSQNFPTYLRGKKNEINII